uniref:EGF-like domain-containing protein n=1 Tax=Trichuris muris TaxID=70415 RepID=A0A5S6QY32_TRIMR
MDDKLGKVVLFHIMLFWWSQFSGALCPHELKWAHYSGFEQDNSCVVYLSLDIEENLAFDDLEKSCQTKFGPSAVFTDSLGGDFKKRLVLPGKILRILGRSANDVTVLWANFEGATFAKRQFTFHDGNMNELVPPMCVVREENIFKYFDCSSLSKQYTNDTYYGCRIDKLDNCEPEEQGCKCKDGYEGDFCASATGTCGPNVCKNNGYCIPQPNGYTCLCPDGLTGKNCENDYLNECGGVDCNGRGTCKDLANDFKCQCTSPYYGIMCEFMEESGASAIGKGDFVESLLFPLELVIFLWYALN